MQHHSASKGKAVKKNKWISYKMFLLILPFLILLFIFSYLPLYGWTYAFFDYPAAETFAVPLCRVEVV